MSNFPLEIIRNDTRDKNINVAFDIEHYGAIYRLNTSGAVSLKHIKSR